MSKDLLTFYNYINSVSTFKTSMYKRFLPDCIDILPEKVCSSKIIYNIIQDKLNTNEKVNLFNECFMEYFTFKLKL